MQGDRELKMCVVGLASAGKTCLIIRYIENTFLEGYPPTVVYVTSVPVALENVKSVSVSCWDYAGRDESNRLRPLMYPGAHIMLICFDVCSQHSFEAVTNEFLPELEQYIPGAVRILVGTKSDLRTDPDMVSHMNEKGKKYITLEQAQEVQRKIKAVRYIETSAKTGNNVKECMSEAVMAVINNENVKPYKRKKTGTCLML